MTKEYARHYLQSRYYDANTGRFISPDKALYHNILGFNMYAYCYNDPVNYFDPSGESASSLLLAWLSSAGLVAAAEPTPIGEIVIVAGLITIGSVWLGESIYNGIQYVEGLFKNSDETTPSSGEPAHSPEIVVPGQQPTKEEGYVAPKGGPVKGKTKDGRVGWKDKNGNIWVPAPTGTPSGHGGGHWDVQSPKGGYTNVYPGGKIRGGKAPYPNIPIFP